MLTIEQLQARIERINERLECWSAKPQTDKRVAKIERLKARQDRLYARIAAMEERAVAAIERAEPLIDEVTGEELVKDSFTFRVVNADWGSTVYVDIFDSPDDDRFTAGDPLWLKATASGKHTGRGWLSTNTTVGVASGDYWEGGSEQTVLTGQSIWADWPEFSHLALTLSKDKEMESIVETADLLTADLF